MTCIETQKKMTQFINEELNKGDLEDFLVHIRSCESCREDLEVYYTVFAGIKLLDEDRNKGTNDQVNFERKLKHAEEIVHREKMKVLYKKIIIVVIIIIIAIVI
ncbi:MAG: zf-HC2 domain-containing protein [Acetivibrio sp.]